jgi:hypothetical protein
MKVNLSNGRTLFVRIKHHHKNRDGYKRKNVEFKTSEERKSFIRDNRVYTEVTVYNNNTVVLGKGRAYTAPEDAFNKHSGVTRALARALKDVDLSSYERKEVYDNIFKGKLQRHATFAYAVVVNNQIQIILTEGEYKNFDKKGLPANGIVKKIKFGISL